MATATTWWTPTCARDGEAGHAGHLALTVKRTQGGICSNYVCDLNCAYSRSASHPRRHVQDLLRERHVCVARLLADGRSHIYLCGLKGMETGVLEALAQVCRRHDIDWDALRIRLSIQSRLHIETY